MEPDFPSTGIIEQLSDEERGSLKSYGESISRDEGQPLIEEGQDQDSLFLLLSGSMEITMKPGDRKLHLGKVSAGQCVGEVNMFDPQKASATVTALEFCQVWRINRQMLEMYLNDDPAAAAKLLIGIAEQLGSRVRKTNAMVSKTRNVLPQLSQTLKEVKDAITEAQDELPGMIAML